ncbi:hypothetical protein [Halobacillus salinus]|uniref:Uncharacterized protein n=1 Tax=Halobacillus salinus TaxID=192814 RepID=A0A4Z0H446_9BACI|nr:hypothetical protein [Halobacillus salinus]TGB05183.1 hypothetical protein E4663_09390 [Halobacillus salinus]
MSPIDVNIVKSCTGIECVTLKDWFSIIGTILGATLGAGLGSLGSYLLFKRKLSEEGKKTKREFHKEYKRVNKLLELVIDQLDQLYSSWESHKEKKPFLVIVSSLLQRVRKEILNIPHQSIPDDIFDNVEELEDEIGCMEANVNFFHIGGEYVEKPKYLIEFKESLDKIKQLRTEIDKFKKDG